MVATLLNRKTKTIDMKKEITKLKDDKHYYGEFGKNYLSNSDIMTLLTDPKQFRKDKEMTKAMLLGRYFHTAMLEPNKLTSEEFISIDASSRNTKKYKESILENKRNILMLDKELHDINKAISTMKKNLEFYEEIYDEENEFEVPAIQEIMGILWKGKADVVGKDIIIDLKTTSNLSDFRWSARKYNYDSQAYIYQCLFGKPVVFYVVDKLTFQLGIFHPSKEFVLAGKEKVEKAIEVYNTFFSEKPTEDIDNYVHREIL